MNNKILKCINVSKQFFDGKSSLEVLKNIDLTLEENSSIAIVGPSGSGKTTLLNIISGLDTPSSGKILYKDKDINLLSEDKKASIRNEEIGFVYQFHHLLPEFTAKENVSLPMLISGINQKEANKKSTDLLERVNLENRLDHKPSQLSGGERQRVAIARSLANNPSCLVLDEPTGDLDVDNALKVTNTIINLAQELKISIVVATHDISLSSKMDNIFNLKGY
ncbi:MAG: lipoprotein-releasing system ATP-binding protein LolD [Gammaproteobacteria bacterium]|nr:lipoprotein-releasing system ATP-binding protein LolD [Gammaproteobacteria bacterium]|tara:strand:- start:4644 stop:5309 length:666 start_codon:yes stop_codon:yes gene_type:complete